ncbi:MAG: FAD-dependent oxidoreductase [Acidobacteria bacterium]|nr:FAD-dependent oxidoreductase [Acidobacteriota bacterium]
MSENIGSSGNPLRVAIIGTGPSGMFAAGALLKSGLEVRVDLFDKLPTPYGLVRYGVAPDHQKIKKVAAAFERTGADERVRFFGNVKLGRDVTREELLDHYHQIVYAVGAQADASLGIPGEDLEGSISSTELVNWYNGHPELEGFDVPLEHRSVAIIGIGNVAIDVARILAKRPEDLATTDISDAALAELSKNHIREIFVLARRGPVEAKCTPKELSELSEVEGAQAWINPDELELGPESEKALEEDRSAQQNIEIFRRLAGEALIEGKRHIHFKFLVSPVEILGENGRVTGLKVERNRLVMRPDGRLSAEGTGEMETLAVSMVVRAVGYRSRPLPDVPFDENRAIIPNQKGTVGNREYAVGWIKRGPTGLIGTNKGDANETVESMLAEIPALGNLEVSADIAELLNQREVRFVTWEEWRRLDELETERGSTSGRPRVKFATISEMLEGCDNC